MALKGVLPSLDGVEEPLQKLYKKTDDGTFVLDVEGLSDPTKLQAKLEEFRTNNHSLQNALKELKEQAEAYKGIDPTKAKEALEQLQKIQDKKMLDEGKIEELFAQRTERMKSENLAQLSAKEKVIEELKQQVAQAGEEKNQFILLTELGRALENPDFGFYPGLADLLKPQVFKEFQYRDEKVVRVKPDGSLMYGKNGDAIGLTEFLQEVAKERPYLVKPSSGSGARNTTGANGTNGQKTIKRDAFEALSAIGKAEYAKSGGKILD